jgi:hypothetical protein
MNIWPFPCKHININDKKMKASNVKYRTEGGVVNE